MCVYVVCVLYDFLQLLSLVSRVIIVLTLYGLQHTLVEILIFYIHVHVCTYSTAYISLLGRNSE